MLKKTVHLLFLILIIPTMVFARNPVHDFSNRKIVKDTMDEGIIDQQYLYFSSSVDLRARTLYYKGMADSFLSTALTLTGGVATGVLAITNPLAAIPVGLGYSWVTGRIPDITAELFYTAKIDNQVQQQLDKFLENYSAAWYMKPAKDMSVTERRAAYWQFMLNRRSMYRLTEEEARQVVFTSLIHFAKELEHVGKEIMEIKSTKNKPEKAPKISTKKEVNTSEFKEVLAQNHEEITTLIKKLMEENKEYLEKVQDIQEDVANGQELTTDNQELTTDNQEQLQHLYGIMQYGVGIISMIDPETGEKLGNVLTATMEIVGGVAMIVGSKGTGAVYGGMMVAHGVTTLIQVASGSKKIQRSIAEQIQSLSKFIDQRFDQIEAVLDYHQHVLLFEFSRVHNDLEYLKNMHERLKDHIFVINSKLDDLIFITTSTPIKTAKIKFLRKYKECLKQEACEDFDNYVSYARFFTSWGTVDSVKLTDYLISKDPLRSISIHAPAVTPTNAYFMGSIVARAIYSQEIANPHEWANAVTALQDIDMTYPQHSKFYSKNWQMRSQLKNAGQDIIKAWNEQRKRKEQLADLLDRYSDYYEQMEDIVTYFVEDELRPERENYKDLVGKIQIEVTRMTGSKKSTGIYDQKKMGELLQEGIEHEMCKNIFSGKYYKYFGVDYNACANIFMSPTETKYPKTRYFSLDNKLFRTIRNWPLLVAAQRYGLGRLVGEFKYDEMWKNHKHGKNEFGTCVGKYKFLKGDATGCTRQWDYEQMTGMIKLYLQTGEGDKIPVHNFKLYKNKKANTGYWSEYDGFSDFGPLEEGVEKVKRLVARKKEKMQSRLTRRISKEFVFENAGPSKYFRKFDGMAKAIKTIFYTSFANEYYNQERVASLVERSVLDLDQLRDLVIKNIKSKGFMNQEHACAMFKIHESNVDELMRKVEKMDSSEISENVFIDDTLKQLER